MPRERAQLVEHLLNMCESPQAWYKLGGLYSRMTRVWSSQQSSSGLQRVHIGTGCETVHQCVLKTRNLCTQMILPLFFQLKRENAIPNDSIHKEIHYLTLQKQLTKLQGWSIQKCSDILQGLCLLCQHQRVGSPSFWKHICVPQYPKASKQTPPPVWG